MGLRDRAFSGFLVLTVARVLCRNTASRPAVLPQADARCRGSSRAAGRWMCGCRCGSAIRRRGTTQTSSAAAASGRQCDCRRCRRMDRATHRTARAYRGRQPCGSCARVALRFPPRRMDLYRCGGAFRSQPHCRPDCAIVWISRRCVYLTDDRLRAQACAGSAVLLAARDR